jgi:oligopeptidase B
MPPKLPAFIALAFLLSCTNNNSVEKTAYQWPAGVNPPVAEKKSYVRTIHGDSMADPYYWMIDFFKKGPDSTKVVDYLTAENTYVDTMMSASKTLQEDLFKEMKARIKEKDESVPVFKNGYYYYTRSEEGQQYFKYCRKKGNLDAKEEILLDVDDMAKGHGYYSAAGFNISDDNKLMAFGVDTVSRRQYVLYIKNLETGELYKDEIHHTGGGSVWANDNKTLFYTENNQATLLSEKIKRHKLDTDASHDAVVYDEKDHTNYIGIAKTKSGKFIIIITAGTLSSESLFIDASKPDAAFKSFQPRMKEVLYEVTDDGDKFLIVTNLEAKNFRLMSCPYDKTDHASWKEEVPHRTDVLLEGVEEFKNFLVINERKNGLRQMRVRHHATGKEYFLDFGEPAYTANPGSNPEFNTSTLRYNYTSLTTPNSVYDYNMDSQGKKLMKQQEVVGGYDPKEYVTERLYATARDSTKVPISLVYKKGFEKNGKAALLLYGYGSYGNSLDASFSANRLSLLNRGFVYAIAHIRGGQEMGRLWYEDGKMMKKKNTFTDFIDCAQYLVDQQYTTSQHLYAQGGSAGGLLMGAVVTMRPDLFHGIVAQVPFVDVVNTMLDESIPLTTNEFDEWGNPKNKESYDYMKSYSPYENVAAIEYPNMLVTTGLHDSQVQYFEPAKWVAKIRATGTGKNLIFLHTNMKAGHGGASGRFDYLKEIALIYAFLFALEEVEK